MPRKEISILVITRTLLQKLSYHWNFIFQGSVKAYDDRQAQSLLSHGLHQWSNTVLLKWPASMPRSGFCVL